MAWTKTTSKTTKHTCDGPVFGKLTPGCARCDELAAGAAPRQWIGVRSAAANRIADLRALKSQMTCIGHVRETNPGGYCIVCGKGRDFS